MQGLRAQILRLGFYSIWSWNLPSLPDIFYLGEKLVLWQRQATWWGLQQGVTEGSRV